MKNKKYSVQEFSSKESSKRNPNSFEISVIRNDNKHGKESYGWGGINKIILFESSGTNEINDCIKKQVRFARKCAKILCKGLNKKKKR